MSVEELCAKQSGAFKLQDHQRFLKSKLKSIDRLLLFHGIGSGKTCSSISLAAAAHQQQQKKKNKTVVVLPASLKGNFVKELNGPCGDIQAIDKFNKHFDIMSYQGFVKRYRNKDLKLNNTLVIVDEVQNIVSETGDMYGVFMDAFQKMKGSKLVCLSATPMFDKPVEIALLGNMLLTKEEYDRFHLPTVPKDFARIVQENPRLLYLFFKNKVSYFRGADPRAYPEKFEHRVDCVMSDFQRQVYFESIGHLDITNVEKVLQRAFLIAPRQTSNMVLPNGNVGKLRAKDIEKGSFDLKKYSTKFHKCIQNIARSPGPVFVYSNFVSSAGTDAFALVLSKLYGYQAFDVNAAKNNKKKAPVFGVFRANTPEYNTKLLKAYNSPENRDGSRVRVILGSPTMKEGISLLRTRQIHLLDPYWNRSRTEQIMGRGVRFCCHADLPEDERKVDVFHYYAIPSEKDIGLSVDLRILQLSSEKSRKINILETILKETSVDCERFKHRNEPPELFCFNHAMVSDDDRRTAMPNSVNNSNNSNVNASVMPRKRSTDDGRKTKTSSRPMQFESTTSATAGGGKKKRGVRSSCPVQRRANELTGDCPESHPYKRDNKKGDPCCYKRKPKSN